MQNSCCLRDDAAYGRRTITIRDNLALPATPSMRQHPVVGNVRDVDQNRVPGGAPVTPPGSILARIPRVIRLSSRLPAIFKLPLTLGSPHHGNFSEIEPSGFNVRSSARMTP